LNWGWSFCRALPYHLAMAPDGTPGVPEKNGASDEARTRYLHLGKVALYQMSYTRIGGPLQGRGPYRGWCLRSESNQRHEDFQSSALPTELQRRMATRKGLEPSTSGVTGRRSNQLNYRARQFAGVGGGNNRARTCDPMLVRHVLYQLSYAPVSVSRTHTACSLYSIGRDLSTVN
jgi:hypothetical protein